MPATSSTDPDRIEAGKLRYLAGFLEPPGPTENQDTYGQTLDKPAPVFQAWVSLEAEQGIELVTGMQFQANVTYVVTMRWFQQAMNLRASWEMTLPWPTVKTPRTFELLEPPRDLSGRRKKLTFRVKESTKTTGG